MADGERVEKNEKRQTPSMDLPTWWLSPIGDLGDLYDLAGGIYVRLCLCELLPWYSLAFSCSASLPTYCAL